MTEELIFRILNLSCVFAMCASSIYLCFRAARFARHEQKKITECVNNFTVQIPQEMTAEQVDSLMQALAKHRAGMDTASDIPFERGTIHDNRKILDRLDVPPGEPMKANMRTMPYTAISAWNAAAGQLVFNLCGINGEAVGELFDQRFSWMSEELREVHEAMLTLFGHLSVDRENGNTFALERMVSDLMREIGDLLFITYGTAYVFGFPIDAILAEILRSNNTKIPAGGVPERDDTGKFRKGPNYEPPNLLPLAREYVEKGLSAWENAQKSFASLNIPQSTLSDAVVLSDAERADS